jgi:hypothetical protein
VHGATLGEQIRKSDEIRKQRERRWGEEPCVMSPAKDITKACMLLKKSVSVKSRG